MTDLPVRAAKFVARKQWVVAGADDMLLRVYNYNTMDKVRLRFGWVGWWWWVGEVWVRFG